MTLDEINRLNNLNMDRCIIVEQKIKKQAMNMQSIESIRDELDVALEENEVLKKTIKLLMDLVKSFEDSHDMEIKYLREANETLRRKNKHFMYLMKYADSDKPEPFEPEPSE